MRGENADRQPATQTPAGEHLEYVLPARRLAGTRADIVDELDDLILALVALRQRISRQPVEMSKVRQARPRLVSALAIALVLVAPQPGAGQTEGPPQGDAAAASPWQYGAFLDLGYLRDFNDPPNRVFRNRGTTWHVNDLHLNMSGAYLKRKATSQSRWGAELLVQTGKDDEVFGFSATAPNLAGNEWLRHLGLANVSYVAPAGKGLKVQGGIFGSLIGYDSLYAKDNFNYTRPWGADFTPYLMLGINASYGLTDKLTGTVYAINGYWHLANANGVPSSGLQLAYQANNRVSVKETILAGPHQTNTSLPYWRFLSDTIVELRSDRLVVAGEYHFSTERVDAVERVRVWWMAAQIPVRWRVRGPLSIAVRPEIAWDSHGRWTLAEQFVTAITGTLEYRVPRDWLNAVVRAEYRLDDSRGPGGGFFAADVARTGAVSLTPRQQLLILAAMLTFDSPAR